MNKLSKKSIWFTIVVVLSVIGTMMAGLLSTFLSGPVGNPTTFQPALGGWINASGGLISFALIYVASDIISEIWGYKASRMVSFINVGAGVLLTILMGLAWVFTKFIIDFDTPTLTYMVNDFFGVTGNIPLGGPILLIWGWLVAISGDWVNDIIFKIFKKKDGKAKFLKRSLLSSVGGQVVDSLLFVPMLVIVVRALHGDFMGDGTWLWPVFFKSVFVMVYCQIIFKLGVELLFFPLTRYLKKKGIAVEGDHAYDEGDGYGILG